MKSGEFRVLTSSDTGYREVWGDDGQFGSYKFGSIDEAKWNIQNIMDPSEVVHEVEIVQVVDYMEPDREPTWPES